MITSTTSTDRTARPEILPTPAKPTSRSQEARLEDQVSIENAVFLRAELARQPEVRSEVVARARALAADPGYPPREAVEKVAQMILQSRDLSEDQS
jgi:hypothetical protein